jgi:hypothetical protein
MITELTPEMLTGKRFVFGAIGQGPWTDRLILSENGKVAGYQHPNEAAWDVRDGNLRLTTADGAATTEFDLMTLDDGGLSFQGRPAVMNDRVHRLTEYRIAAGKPASVAIERPLSDIAERDVVVLLRSYKCDAKYHDLKQKLERGRTDFDLYSIVDETRGRADIPDVNVVWHSLAACRALGLSHDHPALLYACSDLPFYFALRELPRYKHYILIEDDVDMVSGDATFLNEVARLLSGRHELDLVALLFHEHAEKKGWYNACSKVFPRRTWHFAYFPFVVLSHRAAAYMFSQRLVEAARHPAPEDVVHCEAFVATALMAAGYNCLDLNKLRPRSYAFATMAMQIGDKNIGRPMGYDITREFKEPVEMVHPIYTVEEYLDRVVRRFGSNDRAALLDELSTPWADTIPRVLRDGVIAGEKPGDRSGAPETHEPTAPAADVPQSVAPVLSLTFGSNGNATHYLANGWSTPDPEGRWMTGDASEIWLENPGTDHDFVLELDVSPFMPDATPRRLEIVVRGETVLQVTVDHGQVVYATIKGGIIREPGPIRIELRHPDHRRPPNRDDGPALSFAVTGLRLSRILPRPLPNGGADALPSATAKH